MSGAGRGDEGLRHFTLALLLVVSACAPDATPAPTSTFTVDTLAGGLPHVINRLPGLWGDSGGWELEEVSRLGVRDEEGPEQFSQIAGLLSDSLGRLLVLDFPAQDIRVFEADGTFSHRIGRKGRGPGEFEGAAGMNLGPEGRLWVWDPGNRRFSVFEVDGTFVTSHVRRASGVIYPWRGRFTPDGRIVDWGLEHHRRESDGAVHASTFYPIRYGEDLESQDTLPPLSYGRDLASNGRALPFGRGLSTYQDRSGHVWIADSRDYTLYRRTLEGDTVLAFTLEAQPAAVDAAARDSLAEAMTRWPPDARVDLAELPATRPVIRRIFGDDRGHVFVLPELAGVPPGSAADVFTEEGVYLGRIDLPRPASLPYPPPRAAGEHLWIAWHDELDIPFVSKYRIVRDGAAVAGEVASSVPAEGR